jgi:hypothetical protein
MAKIATVTNVDDGDDLVGAWGDLVKTDIEALFADKTIYTQAYAATTTFDLNNGAVQMVTLAGNPVLAISNALVGRPFYLIVKQGGAGNGTVTWFSTIYWSYGLTPTLSTGANKYDVFMFIPVDDDPATYLGFIVGQDMGA